MLIAMFRCTLLTTVFAGYQSRYLTVQADRRASIYLFKYARVRTDSSVRRIRQTDTHGRIGRQNCELTNRQSNWRIYTGRQTDHRKRQTEVFACKRTVKSTYSNTEPHRHKNLEIDGLIDLYFPMSDNLFEREFGDRWRDWRDCREGT